MAENGLDTVTRQVGNCGEPRFSHDDSQRPGYRDELDLAVFSQVVAIHLEGYRGVTNHSNEWQFVPTQDVRAVWISLSTQNLAN
jgi:hypothetical protein